MIFLTDMRSKYIKIYNQYIPRVFERINYKLISQLAKRLFFNHHIRVDGHQKKRIRPPQYYIFEGVFI